MNTARGVQQENASDAQQSVADRRHGMKLIARSVGKGPMRIEIADDIFATERPTQPNRLTRTADDREIERGVSSFPAVSDPVDRQTREGGGLLLAGVIALASVAGFLIGRWQDKN